MNMIKVPVMKPGNEGNLHFATKMAALYWINQQNDHQRKYIAPEVKLAMGRPDLLELTYFYHKNGTECKFRTHLVEVELKIGNISCMSDSHYRIAEGLRRPDLVTLIVPYNIKQKTEKYCPDHWQIVAVRPKETNEGRLKLGFNWVRRHTSNEIPLRDRKLFDRTRRRINKGSEKLIRTRLDKVVFDKKIDLYKLFDQLD